jgi:hypothetical protein
VLTWCCFGAHETCAQLLIIRRLDSDSLLSTVAAVDDQAAAVAAVCHFYCRYFNRCTSGSCLIESEARGKARAENPPMCKKCSSF